MDNKFLITMNDDQQIQKIQIPINLELFLQVKDNFKYFIIECYRKFIDMQINDALKILDIAEEYGINLNEKYFIFSKDGKMSMLNISQYGDNNYNFAVSVNASTMLYSVSNMNFKISNRISYKTAFNDLDLDNENNLLCINSKWENGFNSVFLIIFAENLLNCFESFVNEMLQDDFVYNYTKRVGFNKYSSNNTFDFEKKYFNSITNKIYNMIVANKSKKINSMRIEGLKIKDYIDKTNIDVNAYISTRHLKRDNLIELSLQIKKPFYQIRNHIRNSY